MYSTSTQCPCVVLLKHHALCSWRVGPFCLVVAPAVIWFRDACMYLVRAPCRICMLTSVPVSGNSVCKSLHLVTS